MITKSTQLIKYSTNQQIKTNIHNKLKYIHNTLRARNS